MPEHRGPCVIVPAEGTYYRIVKQRHPLSREDFLSQADQPHRTPRRSDPAFLRHWSGVSVFDTPEQARANAARFKWKLGTYIATIVIEPGTTFFYERIDDAGHGCIYEASADDLIGRVAEVIHEADVVANNSSGR